MTSSEQKKIGWVAYACPICRFIFKVQEGKEKEGVICPACSHLLYLPQWDPLKDSEMEKKLAKERSQNDLNHIDPSHAFPKKRENSNQDFDWEQDKTEPSSDQGIGLIVGGLFFILILSGAVAWVFFYKNPLPPNPETPQEMAKNQVVEKKALADSKKIKEKKVTSEKIGKLLPYDVRAESNKVLNAYLNAQTASDLEKLVRTPKETIPKMRAWYAKFPWVTPKGKVVDSTEVPSHVSIFSRSIQLPNFTKKSIVLEGSEKGCFIDWESLVQWNELPWKELFKQTPKKPTLVRVFAKKDSYYNGYFRDEKWQCYQLIYSVEERPLYGYVLKDSRLFFQMERWSGRGKIQKLTLKIKFPEKSFSDNQVIIENFVQFGWVRPLKSEEKVK